MRAWVMGILLLLALIAGASALDGYGYYQTISYSATDVSEYQQDLVIHRATGTAYEETSDGLNVWHLYVGDHCRDDYGDLRFTGPAGGELAYYIWPDYTTESARVCVRIEGAAVPGVLTIWYGDPTAETGSDGDAVGYCDSFSNLGDMWDTSGVMSATIDGDRLETTGVANTWTSYKTAAVRRPVSLPGAFSAEADLEYVATSGCLGKLFLVVETASGFSAAGYQDNNNDAAGGFTYILNGGSEVFTGKNTRDASGTMHLKITRDASNAVMIYESGTLRGTGSMAGNITAIGLTNIRFQSYAGNLAYWDNFVVRAYSATPPSAATFSGELLTTPPVPTTHGLRPKASATLATIDESGLYRLIPAIGGDRELNETTEGVDWLGIEAAAETPYTAAVGALFFAIIFSLPFIMQWLRQGNMAIPSVIGIVLGGVMLTKAPAEYHLAAVVFIALAVLGVVWGVIKDRV